MAAEVVRKIKIFYSYAREDKEFRDGIERHLATLKRLGQIITWYDREILAGSVRAYEIDEHIDSADIILLVISSHFTDSDYCWGKEMTRALDRHEKGEALVIPILARPVDLEGTSLPSLEMLPSEARAVTRWDDREEAFLDIATGIRKLVKMLLARKLRDEGYTYYQHHNYDEALAICEQAIESYLDAPFLDTLKGDMYTLKGDILFSQRLYDGASTAYDEAIKIDPDNESAYLGKGRTCDLLAHQSFEQLKREADQWYEKAGLLKSSKQMGQGDH